MLGTLTGFYVEGGKLMGVHEFADEDAVKIAQRCKNVSVEIHPNYKDGKGNEYGEMVFKSSLVQQPVVPGQSPFIAASIAGEQADEVQNLWLSSDITQGTITMALSPENVKALGTILGRAVTPDEDPNKLLGEVVTAWNKEDAAEGDAAKPSPAMLSLQAENNKLRHAAHATSVTAFTASLKGKVLPAKLEAATPKLMSIVAGTDAAPSVLCMSVAGAATTPAADLITVLGDLFADVKPLADIKQLSGGQGDVTPPPVVSPLDAALASAPPQKFGR